MEQQLPKVVKAQKLTLLFFSNLLLSDTYAPMRLNLYFSRHMQNNIFKCVWNFEEEEKKDKSPIHVAQRRALDCINLCWRHEKTHTPCIVYSFMDIQ